MQSSWQEHPVFQIFEEIVKIPRPSKAEEKIAEYLLKMGLELSPNTVKDEYNNVIITKEASPGCDHLPPVILQAHMDMVCEKDEDSKHDFYQDPIDLIEEDGWIHANHTTLGADNGIGLAMALAIAHEDLPLPELRLIFTSDEEEGMTGAFGLDPKFLDYPYLINLDSEEEGFVTGACAGGSSGYFQFDIKRENKDNLVYYKVRLAHLQGGHSGMEILNVPTNAIKVMRDFLHKLEEKQAYYLCGLRMGTRHNVIPNEGFVHLAFEASKEKEALDALKECSSEIITSYLKLEPDIEILWEKEEQKFEPVDESSKLRILAAIDLLPHGVYAMSEDETRVLTSNNLAIVETMENSFQLVLSVRSSEVEKKNELESKITTIVQMLKGKGEFKESYPGWTFREKSLLRDLFIDQYRQLKGVEPEILDIHAGLECACFSHKASHLDMISFGPDILHAHSTKEKLSIQSVIFSYELLRNMLKDFSQLAKE